MKPTRKESVENAERYKGISRGDQQALCFKTPGTGLELYFSKRKKGRKKDIKRGLVKKTRSFPKCQGPEKYQKERKI